ncbi:hypothetical protein DXZ79_02870 [Yersinia rochesterensis]|uniref:Uncharacterized protein n=1 Tax=Yersinia rochesterensis TaxID=1604335 RepID=A0A8D4MXH0_9GAMM|nr:hypothetical protein DXZ79_02870 [Yersinia rochesterensis]
MAVVMLYKPKGNNLVIICNTIYTRHTSSCMCVGRLPTTRIKCNGKKKLGAKLLWPPVSAYFMSD